MSVELEQQVGCTETITEVFAISTLTINYCGQLEGRKLFDNGVYLSAKVAASNSNGLYGNRKLVS